MKVYSITYRFRDCAVGWRNADRLSAADAKEALRLSLMQKNMRKKQRGRRIDYDAAEDAAKCKIPASENWKIEYAARKVK
ncbi:hypothetical protein [Candidatus Tokpelaia sp.]|uniref:hypothetical protein n=1 Tax=Candidatus Tokpelaia sp. TaxID=2233777 RepID=UPI00123BA815|nr:hypothetical protein [Candidatus Tokpelaia sp.]KAA6405776.1 hypothetical protein DPQ22_02835 [Candidatus Tokpelaia sp.]